MHPHSGVATPTFLREGDVNYEDTTGKKGVLPAGGAEWMRAGNGVWHTGAPVEGSPMLGSQLWVALPASEENAPAESLYLAPAEVPEDGPARVLLGGYGATRSPVPAPAGMNYLAVHLKDGERWTYATPAGHTVGWLALDTGRAAPARSRTCRETGRGWCEAPGGAGGAGQEAIRVSIMVEPTLD